MSDRGYEAECEDCKARITEVDENGVSHDCAEKVCIYEDATCTKYPCGGVASRGDSECHSCPGYERPEIGDYVGDDLRYDLMQAAEDREHEDDFEGSVL